MSTRRDFLRYSSLGAGSLALAPFMAHMKAHAAGDPGKLPRRFVFVVRGNGLRPFGIVPEGLEAFGGDRFRNDKLVDEPLKNRKLHKSMAALEPFKDRLSIIQGLSSKICKGPHGGHYGVLGAYTSGDHAPPRKETLDITLSKHFPGIFPHLAFHIGRDSSELIRYLNISAKGKNTRTPAYASAQLAYKDIFGAVLTGDKAKIEAAAQQNLMDFLVDDVKRARRSLNAAEKEKLDHYLHGFEALRDREVKLAGMKDTLRKHAPPYDNKFTSEIETHRLEAHFDIAAATLITGLTNSITIHADELDIRYQGFDHERLKQISVHEVGHTADVEGMSDRYDSNWQQGREMRDIIRTYQMQLIARLAGKLDAVPEGDGTMLDHTLIVFLTASVTQHHTGYGNVPRLVLGNLNGALRTGRYLHYPAYNQAGHRVLANLLTSILHAAGHPTDTYGDRDLGLSESIDQTGPLAELMA